MNAVLNWLRICCVAALVAMTGAIYTTRDAGAQETAKQKIKCWVKCCPWEIGCRWDPAGSSAARKADAGAQVAVKGGQLTAEFKPTGDQKVFEVKQETKLDAQTAESLGFKEVTMLPGQYPLTKLANGMAKVTIKVKTTGANGADKAGRDLKENKGKSKN